MIQRFAYLYIIMGYSGTLFLKQTQGQNITWYDDWRKDNHYSILQTISELLHLFAEELYNTFYILYYFKSIHPQFQHALYIINVYPKIM